MTDMKNYPLPKIDHYNDAKSLLSSGLVNAEPDIHTQKKTYEHPVTYSGKPLWKIPLRYSLDDNGGGYEGL
jgi:hypothetical protein